MQNGIAWSLAAKTLKNLRVKSITQSPQGKKLCNWKSC
jgi:hypothetical protein